MKTICDKSTPEMPEGLAIELDETQLNIAMTAISHYVVMNRFSPRPLGYYEQSQHMTHPPQSESRKRIHECFRNVSDKYNLYRKLQDSAQNLSSDPEANQRPKTATIKLTKSELDTAADSLRLLIIIGAAHDSDHIEDMAAQAPNTFSFATISYQRYSIAKAVRHAYNLYSDLEQAVPEAYLPRFLESEQYLKPEVLAIFARVIPTIKPIWKDNHICWR